MIEHLFVARVCYRSDETAPPNVPDSLLSVDQSMCLGCDLSELSRRVPPCYYCSRLSENSTKSNARRDTHVASGIFLGDQAECNVLLIDKHPVIWCGGLHR